MMYSFKEHYFNSYYILKNKMYINMSSVTEYLSQLQTLTKKNLEILNAINSAFFTKKNHLSVNVGDANYVIPSFISLENKINALEENFNNLIHSPSTGEAYFHVDGNTRSIHVNGYTHTPNSLVLNNISDFKTFQNDIFKDFLTPVPYVNFNISSIPNDIVSVNVKKIIPKNVDLISTFSKVLSKVEGNNTLSLPSAQYKYSELYKMLAIYKEDVDYVEYDTIMKLPIRQSIGNSIYVIDSIRNDIVDDDLDNYITIKIKNDLEDSQYNGSLTYKAFNETIEKPLSVGDQLITFDGCGKMEITEIHSNTNTIVVRVMNGDFLNLIGVDQYDYSKGISDLSKIKFFSPVDFDNDKYINVPLEEDRYVFIAIAPMNDRMNIQAPWGTGVMLDTTELKNESGQSFNEYYSKNVQNIGDILFEITSMMSNSLTRFTGDEFKQMSAARPSINTNDISVLQINKHLNNSTTVKNIRTLYSQKKRYNIELEEVQAKIDEINKYLSTISFDDTNNLRAAYVAQLSEYNNRKNELITSITKVINEISTNVNEAEIPIENAKYRIRGFFDYDEFIDKTGLYYLKDHINGIKVQYRYKTVNSEQGTATTLTKGFVFSDWNNMNSFISQKEPSYDDSKYMFALPENNNTKNEPSFNQIDIPISQGETVDIRLKVVYDFGYPFVETTSDWSDIVNIKFPDEFLKDVKILDIISENNNDIETNRFLNIINGEGIPAHMNDKLIDQDKTYFHNPDNIASGFLTDERRVIPLKDKLLAMDNILTRLQDEILGSSTESLSVSIINGDMINNIYAWQTNNVVVQPYDTFKGTSTEKDNLVSNGTYNYDEKTGIVSTILNISIMNNSAHTVKLFSMFPGNRDITLGSKINSKYDLKDYTSGTSQGVWVKNQSYMVFGWDDTFEKDGESDTPDTPVEPVVTPTVELEFKFCGNYNPYHDFIGGNSSNKSTLALYVNIDNKSYLVENYTLPYDLSGSLAWTDIKGRINNEAYKITEGDCISELILETGNSIEDAEWTKGGITLKDDKSDEFEYEGVKYKIISSVSFDSMGIIGANKVYETIDEVVKQFANIPVKDNDDSFGKPIITIPNPDSNGSLSTTYFNTQTCNQYITFRIRDISTGTYLYKTGKQWDRPELSLNMNYTAMSSLTEADAKAITKGATIYPYIKESKALCIDSDSTNAYMLLEPGQELRIPMMFEYKLDTGKAGDTITKTISFDLRPSLYTDPTNYTIKITAKASQTSSDKLLSANRDSKYLQKFAGTKYNNIILTK